MRSTKPMRVAKTGYIAAAAAFFVLGGLLLLLPDFSLSVFNTVFGIVLIAFGGVKLVGYFSKDLYRLAFQHDMAAGILLIALGILALVRPDATVSFFCIVFGIVIMADGLLKIQIALDAKQFGIRTWWLIFSLAILAAAAGCLLIFRPLSAARAIMILAGVALLVEGGLTLGVALCTVRIIRHQLPDDPDDLKWKTLEV